MRVEALIALGGNLGDVRACFRAARDELHALPDCKVVASSSLYCSKAIGPAGQPDYLNSVLLMETALPPLQLLGHMQQIEAKHGRERKQAWGARTLDLDMIGYGDLNLDTPELTLPHPEMLNRIFVLQPLCDIRPNWHHPRLRMTASQMLEALILEGFKPLNKGNPW